MTLGRRWRQPYAHAGQARRSHRGQAIVWTAVMMPLFLAVIGLAIDGGLALTARRDLQSLADGAARAGAMQIDLQTYRDSGGATVALDEAAARQTATAYLAQQRDLAAAVTTDPQRVMVRVSREVPLSFLRLSGISSMRIVAGATATARYGISSGN